MDSYVGSIILWPIDWVPDGWLACNGQMLNVQSYQALFSLIGAQYGGDGTSTFALPNLTGRVPVGTSPNFPWAKTGGNLSNTLNISGYAAGNVTLTQAQMPAHAHTTQTVNVPVNIPANGASNGTTNVPGPSTVLSKGVAVNGLSNYPANMYTTAAANTNLAPFNVTVPAGNTSAAGGGQPIPIYLSVQTAPVNVSTLQPWAALNFIICVNGIYPPRP